MPEKDSALHATMHPGNGRMTEKYTIFFFSFTRTDDSSLKVHEVDQVALQEPFFGHCALQKHTDVGQIIGLLPYTLSVSFVLFAYIT